MCENIRKYEIERESEMERERERSREEERKKNKREENLLNNNHYSCRCCAVSLEHTAQRKHQR